LTEFTTLDFNEARHEPKWGEPNWWSLFVAAQKISAHIARTYGYLRIPAVTIMGCLIFYWFGYAEPGGFRGLVIHERLVILVGLVAAAVAGYVVASACFIMAFILIVPNRQRYNTWITELDCTTSPENVFGLLSKKAMSEGLCLRRCVVRANAESTVLVLRVKVDLELGAPRRVYILLTELAESRTRVTVVQHSVFRPRFLRLPASRPVIASRTVFMKNVLIPALRNVRA
jgi:hypothetical protein